MRTRFSAEALTLIVAALWLATPRICAAQNVGAAAKSPRVLPAVVTLHVRRADGKTATGTAFLAVRDGLLVTTLHVLLNATKVTATFTDGEVFDCVGIVDRDPRHDVALVRIREFGRPMLTISPTGMKVGDKASAAVVKDGAFGLVAVGVGDVVTPGDTKFYRLTGQIPDGNNGAPLVNADGEVVGMATSIDVGGKTLRVALPSTYMLALVPSLPIKPWTSTPSTGAAPTAPAGAAPTASDSAATMPATTVDTALASTMTLVLNVYRYFRPFSQRLYPEIWDGNPFYRSYNLYTVRSQIDGVKRRLEALESTDPLRSKLLKSAAQLLADERKAIDLDIQCWLLTKDTPRKTDNPDAESDAKQAIPLLESVPEQMAVLYPDFKKFAESSPAFLAKLSPELRYSLGIAKRKSKIVLGAYILSTEPMSIIGFTRDALGPRLGLHTGDLIVSAGGQDFKPTDDIEDFKLLIESHAGHTLEVVVKRAGKLKTLHMKIPGDVVEKYGGA